MEFEYPEVIGQIEDIKAIYDMNERFNPIGDAENIELDLFTGTATERGIRKREELYGISKKDTDTLEQRRYRILVKENDRVPYTLNCLHRKLKTLCGAEGYVASIQGDTIIVKVALTQKAMFQSVGDLLEKMVPVNLVIDLDLLYNQHSTIAGFTHKELATYTHKQIRDEVLKHNGK